MPKPATPAETDHQSAPVPMTTIATPAPQIHMPSTFGQNRPTWSDSRPVKSCEPPQTKP